MQRSTFQRLIAGTFTLVALFAFAPPQAADASTAANSKITNEVTVNYTNTSGDPQLAVKATAEITVNLVVVTPTLNTPGDQSTPYGSPVDYATYTLTSNANGLATYNLSSVITSETDITGSTAGVLPVSLDLGATTLAADTVGANTITVPYDGTNDSIVNGIAAGDTIIISGGLYTVAVGGISENPGTNLATITLTGLVPAAANSGEIVGEQKLFTLTVTPANDPAAKENAKINVTVTAVDSAAAAAAATDATITTVTAVPDAILTVSKVVSNDGITYASNGVTANPAATLYYRITVTNSTAINANSVVITDPVPQFTTYAPGTTTLNGVPFADVGTDSALAAGLTVGTLNAGATATIEYQVTID